MNTHEGYSKKTLNDTLVLLAGGGDKSLSDFLGAIQYDSTSSKLQYKTVTDTSWLDIVLLNNYFTPFSLAIPYIVGPSTDTSAGVWTGTCDQISEYVDGLTIMYVPAVAGASTTTLNINNFGAKTCYFTNSSKLTTHFAVGIPIMLTYKGGTWRRADYDSNSNTWRNVYVSGTSKIGTGTGTKAINFVAGDGLSVAYVAAGTGQGQSGSANYFNITYTNTGVRSITVNGNYLTVDTNGTETDITIPVAVTNSAATIGTSLTTIATIAGTDITAKIGNYVEVDASYGNTSKTIYSLGSKRIFTGNAFTDSPVSSGWVSGIALGSDWNDSHYQHYLVESGDRWYTTRTYSSNKMTSWNTFAYLSDIPSITVVNSNPSITYGDTMTIGSVNGTNLQITLSNLEGTSNFTDGTELLSSYAANTGFATTSYVGKIYRRKASAMYGYIKGKLDSVYATIHSHPYLPLAGGTMNTDAVISRTGSSVAWYQGRTKPLIKTTSYTGYNAILSMKTTNGSWDMGVYTNDVMYLTYITDTNYNANNNTYTYQIAFPKKSGTVALTSDLSGYSSSGHSHEVEVLLSGNITSGSDDSGSFDVPGTFRMYFGSCVSGFFDEDGININHNTSGVTAGTTGTSSATSGSTLAVPYFTVDSCGHITAMGTHTHTISGFLTALDHYKTSPGAGTAGTSSATSGSTLAVPYLTINANGHITGYGTHTHTVTGFLPGVWTSSWGGSGGEQYTFGEEGLRIQQIQDESSGIHLNGDCIHMWAPCDNYCIRFWDEDSGSEMWNINEDCLFSGYIDWSHVLNAPSISSDTWRAIKVNGTLQLGTGTSTGAVNFAAGTNVTLSYSSGTITINSSYSDNNTWRGIYVNGSSWKGTGTGTGYMDITAGDNITLSTSGNVLTISASGGGGDYLPLAGGTMTGAGSIVFNSFETSSKRWFYGGSRNSGWKYDYGGNEALIISAGSYSSAAISFYSGGRLTLNDTSGQWSGTTADMQIKQNCVGIGANVNTSYKLYVAGSVAASSGFVHTSVASDDYVLLAGGGYTALSNLSGGGGSLYYLTLNGTNKGDTTGTSLGSFYAPTSAGTSGYILKSNGSNSAPTWISNSHTLSIATTSDSSSITLAASTKYKLTAGGSTYVFTTPPAGSGSSEYAHLWGGAAVTDLNSTSMNRNRIYYHSGTASNRPNSNDSYGTVLQISNVDNPSNGTSNNWVSLLDFVHDGSLYYRSRVNTSSWQGWAKVLTSANYTDYVSGSSGITISALTLGTTKYYPTMRTGTGSGVTTLYIPSSTYQFYATSSGVYFTSDINRKTNIRRYITNIVENPVRIFDWRDNLGNDNIGFIAQEVEKWCPQAVDTDDYGYKTLNYNMTLSALCGYLYDKVSELENTIKSLKDLLNANKC